MLLKETVQFVDLFEGIKTRDDDVRPSLHCTRVLEMYKNKNDAPQPSAFTKINLITPSISHPNQRQRRSNHNTPKIQSSIKMKFFSILALVATSTAAIAMPTAEARGELGKRACREGDKFCGVGNPVEHLLFLQSAYA